VICNGANKTKVSETTNSGVGYLLNGFANIKRNNKYDIINKNGETLITGMNKSLNFNTKGVSIYYTKRRYGLIDTTGKPIDTATFIMYKPIKNTFLYQFKFNKTDKFGIKNFEGKEIHENLFNKVKRLDSNVFLATEKTNTYLLNAKTGAILLKIKNGKVKTTGNNKYLINKGSKWGLYAINEEWILPLKYNSISRFNASGFATFKKKNEVGYLLTNGSIVSIKPDKVPYVAKDTTTTPLHLDHDSTYIGINSINIPIRYHQLIQLDNGCYLATRQHQYILHSFDGSTLLNSDTWTDAKIMDKKIMNVHTTKGIQYYNLISRKWVWQNQ
jgi:hypothetical protein